MAVNCSNCQRTMESGEAVYYYIDPDNIKRYVCKDCANKFHAVRVENPATQTPVESQGEKQPEGTESAEEETSSTGWVSLLRTLAILWIIGGILLSFISAIPVSEESDGLAFAIIVGGILLTLISAAAIMIFLDMADDIHAIRQMMQKK